MKLNCIIVDDCPIQRSIIIKLVSDHQNLKLGGSFSNVVETKSFLAQNTVDLIFLDVEMPILNGFDFLDTLEVKPQVIFITSKSEYAVRAFDYEATDYVQKPIDHARFQTSVRKALNKQKSMTENVVMDDSHIFIKSNLKNLKIFTENIKFIEAYGDYLKVITNNDKHLVLSTMKSFENELPKDKFVRVHKSYIVNLGKIDKFSSKFIEIGGVLIPVSRTKKEQVQKAIEAI